jgi:hypothetical protein
VDLHHQLSAGFTGAPEFQDFCTRRAQRERSLATLCMRGFQAALPDPRSICAFAIN